MADTYKIKAELDTSNVEQGAREIERRLDPGTMQAGAGHVEHLREATRLTDQQARATARLTDETRLLSFQRRASMILGGGTAAAELAGAGLKAAGMDRSASMLTSAASDAARLGTMLAPLGPQAAMIGAAAGGITGAVKQLTEGLIEDRKRLDAAEQAARNQRAESILSRQEYDALDAPGQAAVQKNVQKRINDMRVRMDVGADIADADIRRVAEFDPAAAREAMNYMRGRSGGRVAPDMQALFHALHINELDQTRAEGDAQPDELKRTRAWRAGMRANERRLADAMLHQDIAEMVRSGTSRLDPNVDLQSATAPPTDRLHRPKANQLSGSMGSVDSFQSIGLGVYANPMQRSEQLLQLIDGKLAVIIRKPGGLL